MKSHTTKAGIQGPIRVGIVGTGFIADFHARGIRDLDTVELVAVCDPNVKAAEAFAASRGAKAYASIEDMLSAEQLHAVHILTPPDVHHMLAKKALESGAHVFVEKPMCVTTAECDDLVRIADGAGLTIGVNHSMVYIPAYEKLRQHVRDGDLGPIDYIAINQLTELGVIRLGPFNNWIVREPRNALLEIGPHLISELLDLAGVPDQMTATADRAVTLPTGVKAYRRWRVQAQVGRVAADINLEFSPGFPLRTITVRGALGSAQLDFNANTCTLDRRTAGGMDFDRRSRSLTQAKQLREQAKTTLIDTLRSKFKRKGAGSPDQISIQNAIAAFYGELRDPAQADSRISGRMGRDVIATCEAIIDKAGLDTSIAPQPAGAGAGIKPSILVVGGTGFIGKRLIGQLLDAGHTVRVAGRSISPVLAALGSDRLEMVRADLRSPDDVGRILDGIDTVFHLATSDGKTWDEYLAREVEPTRILAEACLERGVKRLIYTGTIDSYYAGGKAGTITEDTPLDKNIVSRNYYARAKAAIEDMLMDMHRTRGLPVVIVRPGIVIGTGGNPFHWGVGRWSSEGVCDVWGDGENPLPLVLVDDVAAGLVRAMEVDGVEGKSYNLIDLPLLSARDYLQELQRLAGMKVDVQYQPIWKFWLEDMSKWPVKKAVGHADGSRRPSYYDWESRTQKAFFDCTKTREELGWKPASDRARLIDEGIAGSLAVWLAARS